MTEENDVDVMLSQLQEGLAIKMMEQLLERMTMLEARLTQVVARMDNKDLQGTPSYPNHPWIGPIAGGQVGAVPAIHYTVNSTGTNLDPELSERIDTWIANVMDENAKKIETIISAAMN